MPAPILHTPRLTLRPHVYSDMDPFWAFHQSDRARYIYVPDTLSDQWYGFASEVGSWDLLGHGGWAIDTRDGKTIGQVAITHPPHYPELEIGWILFEQAESRGYAFEAASAALTWTWQQGHETLVSYIHPDNLRSIALAARLGAQHDPQAPLPKGVSGQDTLVYRHSPDSLRRPEARA
jgi:RimJ/RimL family protein N-acetyltransferase